MTVFGTSPFDDSNHVKKKSSAQKYPHKTGQRKPRKPVYTPAEDGTEPTADVLKALFSRGYNYCLWMLGASQKTEKQLREKLTRRGYPEEIMDSVLEKLKEDKYVDDESYARAFAHDRQEFSSKGSRAIKYELLRKGIDSDVVAETIEEIHDPEAEEVKARQYVTTRMRSTRSLERQKRTTRLVSALARRGYDPSMAFRVVREVIDEDMANMEEEGRETDAV